MRKVLTSLLVMCYTVRAYGRRLFFMLEKAVLTHTTVQAEVLTGRRESLGKRGGSCACTYHIGMYGMQTA
ncbi:MAG: hypothetical protein LUH20_12470 [Lachnospiraceae bacterium]|nr:hypothetical protein [Lachnospiraceae bacterium]